MPTHPYQQRILTILAILGPQESTINSVYGFLADCATMYDKQIYDMFDEVCGFAVPSSLLDDTSPGVSAREQRAQQDTRALHAWRGVARCGDMWRRVATRGAAWRYVAACGDAWRRGEVGAALGSRATGGAAGRCPYSELCEAMRRLRSCRPCDCYVIAM